MKMSENACNLLLKLLDLFNGIQRIDYPARFHVTQDDVLDELVGYCLCNHEDTTKKYGFYLQNPNHEMCRVFTEDMIHQVSQMMYLCGVYKMLPIEDEDIILQIAELMLFLRTLNDDIVQQYRKP